MANSELYGNKWTIPNNVINSLNTELKRNDKKLKGYKRAQNIVSDRTMTYSMLKRMKNFFNDFSGNKSDREYLISGGEPMEKWVTSTLERSRGDITRQKRTKADAGMTNQFKKTHTKDKENKNVTKSNVARITGNSRDIMNNRAVYKEMTRIINKLIKE